MENNLTKEDIKFINRLLVIDKDILQAYNSLSLLEYKKRFGTDEFNEVIKRLTELINLENSVYNIENLTLDRMQNIISYLYNKKEKLSLPYETNLCYQRIFEFLTSKIIDNNKNIIQILGDVVQNDLNRITLSLFNDYINDVKYIKHKKNNIIKKYNMIFSSKCFEIENIKNNFNMEYGFTSSIELISKYMNISEEIAKQIKIDILGEIFLYNISIIKKEYSTSYYNDLLFSNLLFLKCMSKACLILLPDMATKGMEANLIKGKFGSSDEANFIKEIFEEVHDDKKRMVNVSFGRNKG